MIPLGPVVARSRVKAIRAAVWSYLADSGRRSEWWPELRLEEGIGGSIVSQPVVEPAVEPTVDSVGERGGEQGSDGSDGASTGRQAEGTVDVWVEGHAVGFTWREAGEDRGTAVLMTLRSQGPETGVTITETGFDALSVPAERAAAAQRGWHELLAGLGAAVEAAGRVRSSEASSSPSGALEIAPEVVDGEVDDAGIVEIEIVEIEVEAEPQVGDHLELDTGSVPVVDRAVEDQGVGGEGRDADQDAIDNAAHDTVEIERLVEVEHPEEPGEPDFDAIIRGA